MLTKLCKYLKNIWLFAKTWNIDAWPGSGQHKRPPIMNESHPCVLCWPKKRWIFTSNWFSSQIGLCCKWNDRLGGRVSYQVTWLGRVCNSIKMPVWYPPRGSNILCHRCLYQILYEILYQKYISITIFFQLISSLGGPCTKSYIKTIKL